MGIGCKVSLDDLQARNLLSSENGADDELSRGVQTSTWRQLPFSLRDQDVQGAAERGECVKNRPRISRSGS